MDMNTEVLNSLQGETLAYIDESPDQVLLTTVSGREFQVYHRQDCCESVGIEDTEGNWHDLVGKPLLSVDEECEDASDRSSDSATATRLTFKVDGATVINKWIGESNGYYSESITIEEICKKGK
tara:strand:+ start:1924 stop:2295 length:372 start_codon:yes stop_codon:yes gene_type:complete